MLVEGDVADVGALDNAAGFPIALYETITDLNHYLAEHGTGLDFAGLVAQVKSPPVKDMLASLLGDDGCARGRLPGSADRSIARHCRRPIAAPSGSMASR